jgi:hypothetical protein
VTSDLTTVRAMLGANPAATQESPPSASALKPGGPVKSSRRVVRIVSEHIGQRESRAEFGHYASGLLRRAEALSSESAQDAGTPGFMAKFLVQTTPLIGNNRARNMRGRTAILPFLSRMSAGQAYLSVAIRG